MRGAAAVLWQKTKLALHAEAEALVEGDVLGYGGFQITRNVLTIRTVERGFVHETRREDVACCAQVLAATRNDAKE